MGGNWIGRHWRQATARILEYWRPWLGRWDGGATFDEQCESLTGAAEDFLRQLMGRRHSVAVHRAHTPRRRRARLEGRVLMDAFEPRVLLNSIVITTSTHWSAITSGSGVDGAPTVADTITVRGTANVTLMVDVNDAVVGTLLVNNTVSSGAFAITLAFGAESALAVANGVTIQSSSATSRPAVIDMTDGGTLSVGGSFVFNNTNSTLTAGQGTIIYSGSGNQTIAARVYHNLVTSGGGNKSFTGRLTVAGDITIGSGTNLACYNNATLTLAGNCTNYGTFSPGNGIVVLNGSGTQCVEGSTPTTFKNLTVSDTAHVSLDQDIAVSATLNLNTSGTIRTNEHTVATVGMQTLGGFVDGSLRRKIFGSGVMPFYVGVGQSPTTVTLDLLNVTTTAESFVTVSTTAGKHLQIAGASLDASSAVNAFWTITGEGMEFSSYSATFEYGAELVDAGADPAGFIVAQYADGAWSVPTAGGVTQTSSTVTGITAFGDFAVGAEAANAPGVSVTAPGDVTNTSPILFAIDFTEAVTGLTIGGLSVGNGTAANLQGDGAAYTVEVTPDAEGPVTLRVSDNAAVNASMKGNSESDIVSIIFDMTAPPPPVVVWPTSAVWTLAEQYTLSLTAEAGSTVEVWRDLDADGIVSDADELAADAQLGELEDSTDLTVTLACDTVNRLLVTATDRAANRSAATTLEITQDSQPPAITGVFTSEPWFSPNGDGVIDQTVINYTLSEAAAVTITITGPDQELWRTLVLGSQESGARTAVWDGTDDQGAIVVDGTCAFRIDATDLAGNEGPPITGAVVVDTLAPEGEPDAYELGEDQSLIVDSSQGVLSNDADTLSTPLAAILVDGPSFAATFVFNADGSFSYAPVEDFHGADTFTYAIRDLAGNVCSAVSASLTIHPVNDAPVAVDASLQGDEDSPAITGSLAASDVEGDELTYGLLDLPTHGTVVIQADGSFSYTPQADFHGLDAFTFQAHDGTEDSNPATVHITVHPVNDAPVAVDASAQGNEDSPAIAGSLAASDVEGDDLTYSLLDLPTHGTVVIQADGSFSYTPQADFHGLDAFTFQAHDAADDSNLATAHITVHPVNDAPVALDASAQGDEDSPAITGSLAASDVEGDELTYSLLDPPTHGTVVIQADGSFSYTPQADFHGQDAFTFRAHDGTDHSNLATVQLTIHPVNDAPVAVDASAQGDEDSPAITGGLTASDVEGDDLTYHLLDEPSHGTIVVHADGSFSYAPQADFHGQDAFTFRAHDGTDHSNLATVHITIHPLNDAPVAVDTSAQGDEDSPAITGSLAASDVEGDDLTYSLLDLPTHGTVVIQADGSFSYTPQADFHGLDAFTFQAHDGTDDSNLATVQLTIHPVNDAPTLDFIADPSAIDEDSAEQTVILTGITPGVAGDESTQVLTIHAHSDNTDLILIVGVEYDGGPTATLRYIPVANAWGTALITVTIRDDGGTDNGGYDLVHRGFAVRVVSVNDKPVISGIETDPFTWLAGSAPAPITSSLVISDVDDLLLQGATISIASFAVGKDTLGFTDQNGISGVFEPETGVLMLSGAATPGAYQMALRSITFTSTDITPGNLDREIVFVVHDGHDASDAARRDVVITPSSTAPGDLALTLEPSSATIAEGGQITLGGSFIDPDTQDTHSVEIDWGDDSPILIHSLSAGVVSFSGLTHTYADDGLYDIRVTVTDSQGAHCDPGTLPVSVTNIAPSLTLSGDAWVSEGETYTLHLASLDPGTDTISAWVIDWGDGSEPVTIVGNPSHVTHIYSDGDNDYLISGLATDEDGTHAANAFAVHVVNVPPTVTLSGETTVQEGAVYELTVGTVMDPGMDIPSSYVIHWGDSTSTTIDAAALAAAGGLLGHIYGDGPASHAISVDLMDEDAVHANAAVPLSVDVTDMAPNLTISGEQSVTEGALYTLHLASYDLGDDTLTGWTIDWGDGSLPLLVAGNPTSVTHTWDDGPGVLIINATASDEDGVHSANTLEVFVANGAPTALLASLGDVCQGTDTTVLFHQQFDPSAADAADLRYAFDLDNDGQFDVGDGTYAGSNPETAAVVPARLVMTPGCHTVRGRIIDKDDGFTDHTTTFNVLNAAPVVNLPASAGASTGKLFTATGSFSDPGDDAPWTGMVDYGDGSGWQPLVVDSSARTFELSHTYGSPSTPGNPYVVRVRITDSPADGPMLTGSAAMNLTVNLAALNVTSLAATATGFDITFNRDIAYGDLSLFANAGTPVTVVGASTGPLRGSLLWTAGSHTAHFVQTTGLLAADHYTLTIASGSNGNTFHDLMGNALDGNDDGTPGDDFIASICVTPAPVLYLPNFARGPMQSVIVNAGGTQAGSAGLPVYISDGAEVTAVDFVLSYDAALLTIAATPENLDLPAGWSASVTELSPGRLHVAAGGPTALGAGVTAVISFKNVTVPADAPYGAASPVLLSEVAICHTPDEPVALRAAAAVHKIVDLGDVTGDGSVGSLDAAHIARLVVGLSSSLPMSELTDPVLIGDLTGDGTLSALDASAAAQMFSNPALQPQVPAPMGPGCVINGADPIIRTGEGASATINAIPGGVVVAGVSISDSAAGLEAAELVIAYDATRLDLTHSDVILNGTLAARGWGLSVHVDDSAGIIRAAVYDQSLNILTPGPADLLALHFTVPLDALPGVCPLVVVGPNLTGQSRLNEGALVITPDIGTITVEARPPGSIQGRHVFYLGSAFDVGTHDAAIATDKQPLLPGQTAGMANYSSYSRGVNGIMIDIAGVLGPLSAADFLVAVGNDDAPDTWVAGPSPEVHVRPGQGVGGSSRVELIWPEGAIRGQWVQVTVLANINTGLPANDLFYFGSAVGETGDSSADARVTSADEIRIRANAAADVDIANVFDINRDGTVDGADQALARRHSTSFLNALKLISVPGSVEPPSVDPPGDQAPGEKVVTYCVAAEPLASPVVALQVTATPPVANVSIATWPPAFTPIPAGVLPMVLTRVPAIAPALDSVKKVPTVGMKPPVKPLRGFLFRLGGIRRLLESLR